MNRGEAPFRDPDLGGPAIFDLISESRSTRSRLASFLFSLLINFALLTGVIVFSEISALEHSYNRLIAEVRRGIGQYRIILVTPRLPQDRHSRSVAEEADHPRRQKAVTQPLAVPDPRLLRRLNPEIQTLVSENPTIESIITREIVRDVDSRVLDVRRLLEKSSIELSLSLDAEGHLTGRWIDSSSGVPSIDHLGLELIVLLEKYQLLWLFRGFRRVGLRIDVESDVEIALACTVGEPERLEEAHKQAQRMLAALRIVAAQNDAGMMLQDVEILTEGATITLRKILPKDQLVDALVRYYIADAAK